MQACGAAISSQVEKRLEALESGLQELAESSKPAQNYGTASTFAPFPIPLPGQVGWLACEPMYNVAALLLHQELADVHPL
jgi:hypothetical protein